MYLLLESVVRSHAPPQFVAIRCSVEASKFRNHTVMVMSYTRRLLSLKTIDLLALRKIVCPATT